MRPETYFVFFLFVCACVRALKLLPFFVYPHSVTPNFFGICCVTSQRMAVEEIKNQGRKCIKVGYEPLAGLPLVLMAHLLNP